MLRPLVASADALTAEFDFGEVLLVSQLLAVEPSADHIILAYGTDKTANERLLSAKTVEFHCSSGGLHLAFQSGGAAEVLEGNRPAVRMEFPRLVLKLQRRSHVRMPVRANFTLRCIADSGGITPFEARIVDVSRGGIGGLVYDGRISLAPGTILRRCEVIPPAGPSRMVDLEVRHTRNVTLADGRVAHLSGCRFIGSPADLEALLKLFVVELRDEK